MGLTLEQLEKTLPSGISSVYQSYFQRLEEDLCKELNITEEQFLCFLSAIAAAREPLPLGFVPKLLCTKSSSLSVMRKVSKAIAIVSSLLPVHDDRIHFFHKSVKDWLTDKLRYKQHNFSVEEMEGHKILSTLCSKDFDELKRKGVGNSQSFADTTRYALEHGVQHMLQLDQNMRSCSIEQVIGNYLLDPQVLYAKICVNLGAATEDVVCVIQRCGLETISTECHETLSSLLIVLKKHRPTLQEYPFTIFQCLLNEGSSKLSSDSRQLLETKYSDKLYMEYLSKNDPQESVQARFECFSRVACFDLSPSLEFMVCECRDGSIQLWSLASGYLKWKRYVKPKHYLPLFGAFRMIGSDHAVFERSPVYAFYRSVVFHPTKDVILPGMLSHGYSFNGDLKPLFPTSKCSFSVCSICGDEILTDCPDDAKCLMVWNLNNGKEIHRLNRDNNILSFAMSPDGKLLAISHSTGCVSLVDRENGFSTLAEAALESVCGMIRFSADSRFIWCSRIEGFLGYDCKNLVLTVTDGSEDHYSNEVANDPSWDSFELESHLIGGFLLGDPLGLQNPLMCSEVVLNSLSLLRNHTRGGYIELVYRNPPTKNTELHIFDLVFSLTGETVYTRVYDDPSSLEIVRVMAWDVSNWELKGQKECESFDLVNVVALKDGILLVADSTLELWNFDLSICLRRWMFGPVDVFPISDDQVACIIFETRDGIILDTVGGENVATFKLPPQGKLITCYRDLQLFASSDDGKKFIELKQLGKTEPLWCALSGTSLDLGRVSFSPGGQFIVVDKSNSAFVLDTVSGNLRVKLSADRFGDWKFISDEECAFVNFNNSNTTLLKMFNVRSGDLLCVIDVGWGEPYFLATCPRRGAIAIFSVKEHNIKIIGVKNRGEKILSSEAKK